MTRKLTGSIREIHADSNLTPAPWSRTKPPAENGPEPDHYPGIATSTTSLPFTDPCNSAS